MIKKILKSIMLGVVTFFFVMGLLYNPMWEFEYARGNSMCPEIGYHSFDLMIPTNKYQIGDIVKYVTTIEGEKYVLHRITKKCNYGNGYYIKGDNANGECVVPSQILYKRLAGISFGGCK